MPFNKTYFEHLPRLFTTYRKEYGITAATLIVKAYGKEYTVVNILEIGASLLSFIYYDDEKSCKTSPTAALPDAWPALTIPYEVIESVEFNPGRVPGGGKEIDFKPKY
jgi:hypothetical protein